MRSVGRCLCGMCDSCRMIRALQDRVRELEAEVERLKQYVEVIAGPELTEAALRGETKGDDGSDIRET